ncbi:MULTISPECIES: S8 family peptidase [Bacillus cereus group]|uniref:S8 family peptidase n=1 Tax=Bacillus cereus group TaxID=86661 RepID=UPI0018F769FA|nr:MULTISPECIES: S8 family peptidase [Bacillus cereus group]MBJ7935607.1 S8 family peptidase [Bacillus cereus]
MFKAADYVVRQVVSPEIGKDLIDWGLKAIGVELAWQKTKGEGIKVAILDTGIDEDHPDLIDNVKEYIDFTNSPSQYEDMQGHGTHVAGIVAAMDNGIGMVGVAPKAELYCAKVLGDNGKGGFEAMIRGIKWAIDRKVDIISMSLGTSSRPPEVLYQVIKQATAQGIVFVAATGNENSQVCYPAAYDEVIAVSAVDENMQHPQFSNHGIENEICAPGVNILSTYKEGHYARLSGTSMATPIISGAIALILARYKQLHNGAKPSVSSVHELLQHMVKDLGVQGRDEIYGAGIINLALLP